MPLDSSIIHSILNLNLQGSKNIITANSSKIPKVEQLVILDKIELIDILINEDKQSFEIAKENRSKRLSLINDQSDKNEEYWGSAELYLDWALLRISCALLK